MPQSSDDMHELMNYYFGDPIEDSGPIKFLEERGYKLTLKWTWQSPKRDQAHWITLKEELCIRFLQEEWDFGGVVEVEHHE